MLLAFGLMRWLQMPTPKQNMSLLDAVLLFLLFFIGAIGEEVGWTGYVTDPLQNRFGALKAALIIGTVWAVWHIIPFIQAYRTPIWILWQCECVNNATYSPKCVTSFPALGANFAA